jgi:hypothetical protein
MTLEARITEQVRYLLAQGCGYRQIERLMPGDVSHSQVAIIDQRRRIVTGLEPAAIAAATPAFEKCPGCLYRVEMPCKICQARKHRHFKIVRNRLRRDQRRRA